MSDEARQIRESVRDPRALCAALGLDQGAKRQQHGGLFIKCPIHQERTPSCSVTTGEDGTVRFHCFGCQASGDALHLIAIAHGLDPQSDFGRVLEIAADLGGMQPPERAQPKRLERKPEQLDATSYHSVASRLLDLCPFVDDPETLAYCERRVLVLQGANAQLGGLPPPDKQGGIITQLLETFDAETLARAGLLWRDKQTNKPDVTRFANPDNRLVIPWRGIDGAIAVLQRRRLDDGKPKYVFPPGMRPMLPFGGEQLRAHDADRIIVLVEGALDVMALRLLDRRDNLGVLPLGLPGLDGWRSGWARFGAGRHVRIAFDTDSPGEAKVQDVADDLHDSGAARVTRWPPKAAKDWAEVVERLNAGQGRTG